MLEYFHVTVLFLTYIKSSTEHYRQYIDLKYETCTILTGKQTRTTPLWLTRI